MTRLRRGDVDFVPDDGRSWNSATAFASSRHRDTIGDVTGSWAILPRAQRNGRADVQRRMRAGARPWAACRSRCQAGSSCGSGWPAARSSWRSSSVTSREPVRCLWTLPYSANLTLRQLGLILFLAGIGTRAGYDFVRYLADGGGLLVFVAGAGITLSAAALTLWAGATLLGLPFGALAGTLAGVTDPARRARLCARADDGRVPQCWLRHRLPGGDDRQGAHRPDPARDHAIGFTLQRTQRTHRFSVDSSAASASSAVERPSPAGGADDQPLNVARALRLVAEHDLHVVGPAVVDQRDRGGIDRRAVQRRRHRPRGTGAPGWTP